MLLVPAIDTDCDSILQVLVCSDSMTRGVDIDGVQCIINYHPPAQVPHISAQSRQNSKVGWARGCGIYTTGP